MSSKPHNKKSTGDSSPVVLARKVPDKIQKMLWGLTAGRCEFAGCNKDLFEHSVTLLAGNFAQVAHIVAFREDGPRGDDDKRPEHVHDLENLMLLCPECHKLIDDRPTEFTRPTLKSYKRDHEERVRHVTSFGPDLKTSIVQLKALIAGQPVAIPISHIYDAVAPRWPTDRKGCVIDITAIDVEDSAGTSAAVRKIDKELDRLYADGMDVESIRHISLFALAPIHLLTYLGSRMSDKIPVDFFQRHRDESGSPWQWRISDTPVTYRAHCIRPGTDKSKVALVLSLSGVIPDTALPKGVDETYHVYEITLANTTPHRDFLRQRGDLEQFRKCYRSFLAQLTQDHGLISEIQVYPAVPAPVATVLGYDLLPKVHPALRMFDYSRENGFQERLLVESDSRLTTA